MWSRASHEHVTKKKSKSPTGIEPMTFRTPVGGGDALTTELSGFKVAQWLDPPPPPPPPPPTGVRKVVGSISFLLGTSTFS